MLKNLNQLKEKYPNKHFYPIQGYDTYPAINLVNIDDFIAVSSNNIFHYNTVIDAETSLLATIKEILHESNGAFGVISNVDLYTSNPLINKFGKEIGVSYLIDSSTLIGYVEEEDSYTLEDINNIRTIMHHIDDQIKQEQEEEKEIIAQSIDKIILERKDDYIDAVKQSDKNKIIDEIRCTMRTKLNLDGRSDYRVTSRYIKMRLENSL